MNPSDTNANAYAWQLDEQALWQLLDKLDDSIGPEWCIWSTPGELQLCPAASSVWREKKPRLSELQLFNSQSHLRCRIDERNATVVLITTDPGDFDDASQTELLVRAGEPQDLLLHGTFSEERAGFFRGRHRSQVPITMIDDPQQSTTPMLRVQSWNGPGGSLLQFVGVSTTKAKVES
jgi:hypothetical protein